MATAEIQCRLPRTLLQAFADRSAGVADVRHLQAARSYVIGLLSRSPRSPSIRICGSIDGLISILQFVAREIAKDVRAGRPATLAPLGQLLTPIVSRHQFPPRAEPKFSREYSHCFDF
ncbi:MAG: hypothetical protein KGL39_37855 [Patescibacteria group bacterium]|nr:hypothetical protein [Patescibacteria group bacterium]